MKNTLVYTLEGEAVKSVNRQQRNIQLYKNIWMTDEMQSLEEISWER